MLTGAVLLGVPALATERARERMPRRGLPNLARAHRADRKLPADGHAVAALGAPKLSFGMVSGSQEYNFVAVGD